MTARVSRVRLAATLLLMCLISSSCGAVFDDNRISFVDADAQLICSQMGSQILAAQSVRTAAQVPCVEQLPSGWKFEDTNYRSDGVTIDFDSSRPPVSDLKIEFKEACEPASGVVSVDTPSFDPEAAELLLPPDASFSSESISGTSVPGLRIVLFGTGYCIDFEIEFEASEPIGFEDFPAIRFVERSVIEKAVAASNRDRVGLDP